jgi:hypothetical protein
MELFFEDILIKKRTTRLDYFAVMFGVKLNQWFIKCVTLS